MEDEILKKRLRELAERSYNGGRFTFTDFLGMSEIASFYEEERELSYAHPVVFGGTDMSERAVIRFGDPEQLGFEEEFPIDILEIKPLMEKFSDDLTHRDFLGALINLGIERSVLGDIFLERNTAYVCCLSRISEFITEELTRVKHTTVKCSKPETVPELSAGAAKEQLLQVQSERIDAVVAKLYKQSRSDSVELFRQKKVFVNGRQCENNSYLLKNGDAVTVRGFGKFIFSGTTGQSRKGKNNICLQVF